MDEQTAKRVLELIEAHKLTLLDALAHAADDPEAVPYGEGPPERFMQLYQALGALLL